MTRPRIGKNPSVSTWNSSKCGRPIRAASKAINKLGLAYQADDQYAPAIEQFRQLIAESTRDKVTVDSLVPLAQCYLALNNTDDAKRTLLSLLNDNPNLTPDYDAYRQGS